MHIYSMKKFRNIVLLIVITSSFINFFSAQACNVPVFRYALERWAADVYEVVIFHQEKFSTDEAAVVGWLEDSSITHILYANYSVRVIHLKEPIPAYYRQVWENLDSHDLPHLAVLYPESSGIRQIVWDGRLTQDNAQQIVNSPFRQKIADSILSEDAAVWIFLESGEEIKDEAAAEKLRKHLANIGDSLTKTWKETASLWNDTGNTAFNPQNVSFSIIRLSQDDPGEAFLITMLLRSEPDLVNYSSYPMAFPVFGRGRVLYALVGDGINEQTIRHTCTFVTGPCSCEIKVQNPGFDLLMAVNWESGIHYRYVEETGLPSLIGLPELAFAADSSFSGDVNNQQENQMHTPDQNGSESLPETFGSTLITIGIIILVVIMLRMLYITRKKR